MSEKRKHIRYASDASIRIGDGETYILKDISIGGCCIRCSPGSPSLGVCRASLIPEAEAQVEPFDIEIEPCWIKESENCCEVGCFITGFPEGKRYQFFANYLAWRASKT